MNRNTGAVVAMLLGIIAGIFFISAGFDIMPRNYAFFFLASQQVCFPEVCGLRELISQRSDER